MMELFNQILSLQIVVTDKHMYYKTSSLASMVANMYTYLEKLTLDFTTYKQEAQLSPRDRAMRRVN